MATRIWPVCNAASRASKKCFADKPKSLSLAAINAKKSCTHAARGSGITSVSCEKRLTQRACAVIGLLNIAQRARQASANAPRNASPPRWAHSATFSNSLSRRSCQPRSPAMAESNQCASALASWSSNKVASANAHSALACASSNFANNQSISP